MEVGLLTPAELRICLSFLVIPLAGRLRASAAHARSAPLLQGSVHRIEAGLAPQPTR